MCSSHRIIIWYLLRYGIRCLILPTMSNWRLFLPILSSSWCCFMLRGPVRYANDGMLLQTECESVQDDLRLLIAHSYLNCTSNGCPVYNTGGYFISFHFFLWGISSPIFRPVADGFAWSKAPSLYFVSWTDGQSLLIICCTVTVKSSKAAWALLSYKTDPMWAWSLNCTITYRIIIKHPAKAHKQHTTQYKCCKDAAFQWKDIKQNDVVLN